ncbi:hypothetical protein HCG51_06230 [Tolypothrix sp. PCC 7910]|uniref:hypothetical protein n=1 Tax=Tolypothrix sp. PCC 7910 TaxID=2099387 RepID=UPI0014279DAA|nr:hypothetical protein [Tolypothrix sp. PCC 7910]QIR36395.1 hypothetical protein HCG51_06230 [Tolypothrix sp. PCC 7910]
MTKFKICIDTKSNNFIEEISKQGNLLSQFYISINEWVFPSRSWLDFPVIVLNWWIEGYINLFKQTNPIENSFMNGPYEFTSSIIGKNVELKFFQTTKLGNQEVGSYCILLNDYRAALIQATNNLLKAIEQESFSNSDIEQLKDLFYQISSHRN